MTNCGKKLLSRKADGSTINLVSTKLNYFCLRPRTKQDIGHTFDISLQNIYNLLYLLKIDPCCNVDNIYNYQQIDC